MTLKPSFPRCGGEGIEEEEEGVGADETRGSGFEGVPVGAEQGVGVGGLVEVEVSELLPQFSFYEGVLVGGDELIIDEGTGSG